MPAWGGAPAGYPARRLVVEQHLAGPLQPVAQPATQDAFTAFFFRFFSLGERQAQLLGLIHR